MKNRIIRWLAPALVVAFMAIGGTATAGEGAARPSISAGVPFFYYNDLAAAADWYENTLGLKKTTDKDWVAIFQLTPSSYIGLVNATGGTLAPTENKGAILSIETKELEAWYARLSSIEGVHILNAIKDGGAGMIQEFQLADPEGYVVEFFRWKTAPDGK